MDWALRGRIRRGGEGKEECNLFRWWWGLGGWGGGKNVSEAGGVFRKVQVSGWRGERRVCLAV